MDMWIVWAVIGGILVVAEMITLTFFLLWLGFGAFAALVVALIWPDAYFIQVVVGAIVVVLLTIFTRPLTRKFMHSRGFKDAVDELVGKQGEVVQEIGVQTLGIVRIGSETWSASAKENIEAGETVVVVGRTSTVVEVEKTGGR